MTACVGVAVSAVSLGVLARSSAGRIAGGVRVDSLSLGGKTPEEARAALQQWTKKREAAPVTLRFASEAGVRGSWRIPAQKLGLGIDIKKTLEEADNTGREGFLGPIKTLITGPKTTDVSPRPTVDAAKMKAALKPIAHAANRSPKKARFSLMRGGGFGINKETPGLAMDIEASIEAISQAWSRFLESEENETPPGAENNPPAAEETSETPAPPAERPLTDTAPPPLEATLAAKIVPAAVTADQLKQIDGVLGSKTSHYAIGDRGDNIALATRHIDGTLLAPGEIFSYNQTVGPRSARAGFKNAPIIVRGEHEVGIGGGICQVSSTLYNAVLFSDLKIVRRSTHAFPIPYLPVGCDATVVDGAIDFQFRNNTEAPVYIAGTASRGRLTFRILGKRSPGKTVSMERGKHTVRASPVITRRDPSLPAGRRVVTKSGHRGHNITWYRVIRENGVVVRREPIRSYYRAYPTVVVVGSRPAAAPAAGSAAPFPTSPAPAPAVPTAPPPE